MRIQQGDFEPRSGDRMQAGPQGLRKLGIESPPKRRKMLNPTYFRSASSLSGL